MAERMQRLSRRSFLLTAGAAAAAAASIAARNAPSVSSPDKSKRATRGYRASEHVNHYYRTTQV
ncbi:MAG TPA: twin-arginine translocation signal domain-containing protein [Burkholderiales bacterium]|nr:twin-arginine translocation signal domain-containing protein [Burkholderiales bacterium]